MWAAGSDGPRAAVSVRAEHSGIVGRLPDLPSGRQGLMYGVPGIAGVNHVHALWPGIE